MASINQRVEMLIKKVANTKASFAQSTGISSVILSHISSGRNKVSLTAVEQILKAYPKVNAEWLILGKGLMFKDAMDSDYATELREELNELTQELNVLKSNMDKKIKKIVVRLEENS